MANRILKALYEVGKHEVGVLNSSQSRDLVNGACKEIIEDIVKKVGMKMEDFAKLYHLML